MTRGRWPRTAIKTPRIFATCADWEPRRRLYTDGGRASASAIPACSREARRRAPRRPRPGHECPSSSAGSTRPGDRAGGGEAEGEPAAEEKPEVLAFNARRPGEAIRPSSGAASPRRESQPSDPIIRRRPRERDRARSRRAAAGPRPLGQRRPGCPCGSRPKGAVRPGGKQASPCRPIWSSRSRRAADAARDRPLRRSPERPGRRLRG